MWNLSSNRLSYQEYIRLKSIGLNHTDVIRHAKNCGKQCNSNLCTLYKFGDAKKHIVEFRGQIITSHNLEYTDINKAYTPYLREHFGLPTRRNTLVTSDFQTNSMQLQILIGSLLGDGHIPKKCNYFTMTHGMKQIKYMEWKVEQLGCLVQSDIKKHSYYDKRVDKILTNVYVKTIPHQLIKDMKQKFYTPDKHPSIEFIEQLDAIGLAVWYCDDGSIIRNNRARICTNSFQRSHIESVINVLQHRFHFDTIWINKDNMLLFSANDSRRLKSIISPFVPTCMNYKLGD